MYYGIIINRLTVKALIVNSLTVNALTKRRCHKGYMEQKTDLTGACRESRNAHDTVRLLISTARLHHGVVDGLVAGMGVHHSQHRMLMYLSKHEKLLSQKAIADEFNVSPAAVAVMLKRLEKDGYINRCVTDDDNRCNEISITQKGRDMVERSRHLFECIDAAMFDGIDAAELEAFASVLCTIRSNLEKMNFEKSEGGDMP